MNNTPRITVILIFLNEEKFIQEAIESVISQSIYDWELLLVDDGSTDESTAIAKNYSKNNSDRIRYFEHEYHKNRGMSASRNLGIRNARGEYIAFIDADDIWYPEKLRQQTAILVEKPEAAMVYGKCQYWYSWANQSESRRIDYVQEHGDFGDTLMEPSGLFIMFLTGMAALPPPSSVMVRRSVLESTGTFEEKFRGLYEDQVFYTKILLHVPVYVSSKCWIKYRQRAESICHLSKHSKGKMEHARLHYLEWAYQYVSKNAGQNELVLRAIQRELWMYRHYRNESQSPCICQMQLLRRWIKKWVLKFEERVIPERLSNWLWIRE